MDSIQIIPGRPPKSGITVDAQGKLPFGADAFTMTLSNGNATETYTFKKSGATVGTFVIVYTDSTRSVISSGTVTS